MRLTLSPRIDEMTRLLITTAVLAMFVGCNANESKEGRIRNLESQIENMAVRFEQFEKRIQALESNESEREQ